MDFIAQNPEITALATGWLLDNILAHVPEIKSNSVFQLICNLTGSIVRAVNKKK